MTGPIDIWAPVADKWAAVQARVGESDLDAETPCSGWTVRDLVEHTLQWQAMGGAMLGAATRPGDDWETIRGAYASHLLDPSNLEGRSRSSPAYPGRSLRRS